MGVQRGGSCSRIFLRRQGLLQFGVLLAPVSLVFVKGISQTSPAYVAGKGLLFLGRSVPSLGLDLLEGGDCFYVGTELGLGAALAQMIVGDTEVFGRDDDRRLRLCAQNLNRNVEGQAGFHRGVFRDRFRDVFRLRLI